MSRESLPHDSFAEGAVLSSFLVSPRDVGAACAEMGLEASGFHLPGNAIAFDLMAEFWRDGKPIDPMTVVSGLAARKALEDVGGAAKIFELSTEASVVALNARHYIGLVLEKSTLRSVILKCREVELAARSSQDNVPAVVTAFVDAATSVAGHRKSVVRDMQRLAFDKLERMSRSNARQAAVLTGLSKLDRESPITHGAVVLLCGLPKSGKSILSLCVGLHAAKDGHRVLYFSLEDPADALVDRMTANLSRVPIALHHEESLATEHRLDSIQKALTQMAKLPITVRDDVYELGAMLAVIEQHKAQNPDLALVVVDYAQLVQAQTRKQDTREQEVAKVSRAFRLLSIRLNVAFLVLSQLNDGGSARESRALEQDCTAKWIVEETDDRNVRALDIPFQRNGNSRVRFKLAFHGHLSRFENFAGSDDEPDQKPQPKKSKFHHA